MELESCNQLDSGEQNDQWGGGGWSYILQKINLFDRVAGGGGRVAAPQSEESCAMGISGAVNGALSFEHQVICGHST